MADIFTKQERSRLMSLIRGRGNKATELRFIAICRAQPISGWRRGSTLPGRPDFVFSAYRLAVFVDGCFWHGCPLHGTSPRTRASFWAAKITGNKARDRRVNRTLRSKGWAVLRLWEHELTRKREAATARKLQAAMEAARRSLPTRRRQLR